MVTEKQTNPPECKTGFLINMFYRKSILEMKRDHEEQIQRLKKLKDEEIDAVTSATSQTRCCTSQTRCPLVVWARSHGASVCVCRSLTVVIEQMEQFSRRLGDLSSRVESSHENTAQGLEIGARQRDEQLRGTNTNVNISRSVKNRSADLNLSYTHSSTGSLKSAAAWNGRRKVTTQRGHRKDGHTAGRAAETAGEGQETLTFTLNLDKALKMNIWECLTWCYTGLCV